MSIDLGTLVQVDLRETWLHEASGFTPWLAAEENLDRLADELGLELELENTEVGVGPYGADILAKDVATGKYVVIENQIEKTNHDHLGKVITYAAGLDAGTIVWIAKDFSDEHRKALDWLNDHSSEDLEFYGVKIELWRIGESKPAPRFNVVSRPAKIAKPPSGGGSDGKLSEARTTQLEFWTAVRESLQEAKAVPSLQTPRGQYWYDVALGRSGFVLSLTANTWENRIGVRGYLHHRVAEPALAALVLQRSDIERELGVSLMWNPNPDKRDKTIGIQREADLTGKNAWSEYVDWMTKTVIAFRRVFIPRIKAIDLTATGEAEPEA